MKDLNEMSLDELKEFKKQITSRISEMSNKSYCYGEAKVEKQSQWSLCKINEPYYKLLYKTRVIDNRVLNNLNRRFGKGANYRSLVFTVKMKDMLTAIDDIVKDLEGLKDVIQKESKDE